MRKQEHFGMYQGSADGMTKCDLVIDDFGTAVQVNNQTRTTYSEALRETLGIWYDITNVNKA